MIMAKASAVAPSPKYIKLADALREQIGKGKLKPGDRLPSQAELKAKYGISQATMERLHAHLEQDGLIVRMQGKGTFVAERPSRARTGTVGVTGLGFLKDRSSYYWSHILEGIRSVASPAGYQILLIDDDPQGQALSKIDGMFTTSPDEPVGVRPVAGMPSVELITAIEPHSGVVPDDFQGGRIVAEHLLSLGHKRIAMLSSLGYEPGERRIEGFRAAMSAAGAGIDDRQIRKVGDLWPSFVENGRREMRRWLSEDWSELGCTALIAYNDPTAIGIIDTLRASGISVPDDVSVAGYDATGLYDYIEPLLTSVRVPLEEIGRVGMELLLATLECDAGCDKRVVIPVSLRVGRSTGPVTGRD